MNAVERATPLVSLLQLQRRAREAATVQSLGFVIVNETLQLAPYRQAALWTASGLGQVAAVSGPPEPDPQAPYVQWLTLLCRHLMREAVPAGEVAVAALPELVRADWDHWLPAHALWLPMGRDAQPADAGLLLARDDPWTAHEIALLQELVHAYGHALQGFHPQKSWRERLWRPWKQGKLRRWVLAGLVLGGLCPVRLTVLAPAEVVPQDPFMVRAPLEGVIDRFDVRPNQAVQPGTPLFSLDTTALRARMEVARKAVDTAQEEYRQSAQAAVTNDKNRADVALRRGKVQEKVVELDYTAEQLARVQVKSDRAGIAVFADANDWLGKAVNLGERVLLVADPAKVELVAWVPAADLLPMAAGDVLTLYPQGAPLKSYEAKVQSVAYRAEVTREGFLAYRVKAVFDAGQAAPRIGQLGTARLHGGWAPLVYVALRRPLAVARQWLGW
ncbi:efflux RND transporter periplasmic adaptor subunit [Roseateles amylovorans]|uniref:HlyD family efflux transporter periplasmic adaptor subunit n=1 Tax=Roseateles amylovorans TaxID=2978473 RepID=A0ABY6AWI8_9BURK|nr:HlyD family efflux transporter periplasmic adaptor subunit [Roseateles amylovorans]UXH76678.1 HlyD family efflux transporter periplasmic adaptor subunit [Roseateles amylovorans]